MTAPVSPYAEPGRSTSASAIRAGSAVVVDVHRQDRAEVLGAEGLVGRIVAEQHGRVDEEAFAVVVVAAGGDGEAVGGLGPVDGGRVAVERALVDDRAAEVGEVGDVAVAQSPATLPRKSSPIWPTPTAARRPAMRRSTSGPGSRRRRGSGRWSAPRDRRSCARRRSPCRRSRRPVAGSCGRVESLSPTCATGAGRYRGRTGEVDAGQPRIVERHVGDRGRRRTPG